MMDWLIAMLVLSRVRSPPPPVIVTVPWTWQVGPATSLIRKCPAVPVPVAVVDHVPAFAFEPPEALAIQSDGRVIVANNEPESTAPQFAGGEPVLISSVGETSTVVSIESSRAFRTAVLSCNAML